MTLSAKARRLFARHTILVVGASVLATLGLTTLAFSWQQSLLDLSTITHHWHAVSETEDSVVWSNDDKNPAAVTGNWTELEELAVQIELEVEREEEEMIMDRESGMSCREGIERKLRVAVYDLTPFHEEVIGSILSSLNDTGLETDMYRRDFRYGFHDILDTFYPTKGGDALYHQGNLMPKLQNGEYDALIMTSCDEHWIEHWATPSFLDQLPTLTDIPIICLHHEMYAFAKHRKTLLGAAIKEKLTFLSLGEHVKKLQLNNLDEWDADGEDKEEIVWRNVPTEVFVPIFPLPPSIPVRSQLPDKIIPNDVAILGTVNNWGRRGYRELWADLMTAIKESPAEWGYEVSPLNGHFIPSHVHSDVKPFRIHLFGGREKDVEIPAELEAHLLVWHDGLDYVDFYGQLAKMDLVLPILRGDEYIKVRATAAFPAGIISHVPSLVMPHQLKSYNYLEPPAIVLHPDGTSEAQVLAAMRRGQDSWSAAVVDDSTASLQPDDVLLHSSLLAAHGHPAVSRSSEAGMNDWNTYTDRLRTYNAKMLCKALLR
ncbi:hypothetical protein QFC22_003637 [Naganishia vaughanmartiniae]|uniref:Uncharacterized protein n=1 Tax=Naganishia vaughanmartiniae TaxID=1424756 RepID=A0ACC2X6U4_9TREE|nr:hypothetical protein QFC22_003637 [Naganishia vaughanmartiniae]